MISIVFGMLWNRTGFPNVRRKSDIWETGIFVMTLSFREDIFEKIENNYKGMYA